MPLFGQMFSHLARSILIMVMRPFLCLSEEVSFGGWSIVQATLSLSTQQERAAPAYDEFLRRDISDLNQDEYWWNWMRNI